MFKHKALLHNKYQFIITLNHLGKTRISLRVSTPIFGKISTKLLIHSHAVNKNSVQMKCNLGGGSDTRLSVTPFLLGRMAQVQAGKIVVDSYNPIGPTLKTQRN